MKMIRKILFAGAFALAVTGGAFDALAGDLVVVAHRGGSSLGPENALATIEKGIQSGADMVEIDIHQTKDGKVVVCHDQSIDRTTNGKGLIREMTFDELRSFHLIDKDGNITDQQLPTLDEVLELIDGRVKLLVEIKRTDDIYQGIEQQLVDAIASHDAAGWVVAQSFDDSVLETLHSISPDLRLEKLLSFRKDGKAVENVMLSEKDYEKYGYVSSLNFNFRNVSRELVDDIHRHGKEIKIWTVVSPEETPDFEVEGIITDYPQRWTTGK